MQLKMALGKAVLTQTNWHRGVFEYLRPIPNVACRIKFNVNEQKPLFEQLICVEFDAREMRRLNWT